jgi:hypothetical protein
MAFPTYFYPGPLWTQMESGAPTAGLAIMNPASGPGTKIDSKYQAQVKEAQKKGLIVLCYVDTNYAKRDPAVVDAEIDEAFNWYGVNGIFLDQARNDVGGLSFYTGRYNYIKSHHPKALVVINPGTQVDEGYLKTADIICTFEDGYDDYSTKYSAPAWVTKYPASRFWHIVYGANQAQMLDSVAKSKQRHAGWVFVTSAGLPNPYDVLPAPSYWASELDAIKKR